jgi:hypothetical protein
MSDPNYGFKGAIPEGVSITTIYIREIAQHARVHDNNRAA